MTKMNVLEMSLRIQEVKPSNIWILNSSLGYASQRIHLTVFLRIPGIKTLNH